MVLSADFGTMFPHRWLLVGVVRIGALQPAQTTFQGSSVSGHSRVGRVRPATAPRRFPVPEASKYRRWIARTSRGRNRGTSPGAWKLRLAILNLVGPARQSKCDRRRDCHHPAVIAANDLPLAFVHHPVMPVTEQGQIGRLIVPAVEPMLEMMSRGPARRPLASRPRAASVAGIESLARRS